MLVTFYKDSGEIINVQNVAGNTDLSTYNLPNNVNAITGKGNKTLQYVSSNAFQNKTVSPIVANKLTVTADGVDYITLSSIPSNSTITITGEVSLPEQPIASSDTITFDTAGEYQILIESFPSLPYEVTINAN